MYFFHFYKNCIFIILRNPTYCGVKSIHFDLYTKKVAYFNRKLAFINPNIIGFGFETAMAVCPD